MSNEFRQVDLMIGDVRRRRWTTERKLQIIEESYAAGETVSSAARRHGVAPNLLYRWRRLLYLCSASGLSELIVERLPRINGVANIRSSFALKQVKYNTAYPVREIAKRKAR